jgi:predicted dithiol-disulfide oxidoreductase (DUF899 family)
MRFPNESPAYRKARDRLLKEERELVAKVKAVAAKRRKLPLGGELKEDYVFQWASDGKVGRNVRLSTLFGNKKTLLIYSFMFGPHWDKPCPSCTSLMDGFDRSWYSVSRDAAFVAIAKAPARKIDAWARKRGWSQIPLVSGFKSTFQADYGCQADTDDRQWPVMHVFRKRGKKIHHFWASEMPASYGDDWNNHVDTVWAYWNLMDLTPEGRPDLSSPPQNFKPGNIEKHYLD